MAEKIRLTRKAIDRLICPPDQKFVYLYDSTVPGLVLGRTPTGATAFYLYRRVKGRPVRIRLGGFPELTIEQARTLCARKNNDVACGIDPQAQKREASQELTVGELFDRYLENHAKKKRTWQDIQRMFDKYAASLKGRRLPTIRPLEIASLHARIGQKHGKYQANRVLEMLRSMFARGVEWKLLPENPTAGVTQFPERSRERYLLPEEMPAFLAAVRSEPNETLRDFILMLIWTGQRRSNVQAMRWAHVSMDRAVWTIPGDETKTGETYTVPLVAPAMEILTQRLAVQKASGNEDYRKSEYVFPGRFGRGHLKEPKGAWKRILDRAGIQDLRIHDLRRTLGSWQAALGTSLHIIGKSLGHKNAATTAVYARLQLDPVRLSVNQATQAMLDAAAAQPALPAPDDQPGGAA